MGLLHIPTSRLQQLLTAYKVQERCHEMLTSLPRNLATDCTEDGGRKRLVVRAKFEVFLNLSPPFCFCWSIEESDPRSRKPKRSKPAPTSRSSLRSPRWISYTWITPVPRAKLPIVTNLALQGTHLLSNTV